MTFIIGLTGGIGSGKSTAAQFFAECGVPVIDADMVAKDLVKPSQSAFKKIVERYGTSILAQNGEINRKALREKIFNHVEDRLWLEALLHPAIYLQLQEKISEIDYPYCVVVIPLLAEHFEQYQQLVNHVLVIDTSEQYQLEWTAKRDHCSQSLVKKMMLTQTSRPERSKIANTILLNTGNLDELKDKIKNLHQMFLEISKGKEPPL